MNNKEYEESRVEIALHESVFDGFESHFKLASQYAKKKIRANWLAYMYERDRDRDRQREKEHWKCFVERVHTDYII